MSRKQGGPGLPPGFPSPGVVTQPGCRGVDGFLLSARVEPSLHEDRCQGLEGSGALLGTRHLMGSLPDEQHRWDLPRGGVKSSHLLGLFPSHCCLMSSKGLEAGTQRMCTEGKCRGRATVDSWLHAAKWLGKQGSG